MPVVYVVDARREEKTGRAAPTRRGCPTNGFVLRIMYFQLMRWIFLFIASAAIAAPDERLVEVRGLSALRGPAPVAQTLYAETPESLDARHRAAESRRLAAEPAHSIEQGRPTKRDRRDLAQWQRWSASAEDLPEGE